MSSSTTTSPPPTKSIPVNRPPQSTFHNASAIVAYILFSIAPVAYACVELYASNAYQPTYRYKDNYTSQLGVPHKWHHPISGSWHFSPRAQEMNLAFLLNGLLFFFGHYFLLASDSATSKFYGPRLLNATLYMIGFVLIATVPAAPKFEFDAENVLHVGGVFLVIVCGNLNSLLVGYDIPEGASRRVLGVPYKFISLTLGATGLLALPIFINAKEFVGAWERVSLYSIQLWMFLTADQLLSQINKLSEDMEAVEFMDKYNTTLGDGTILKEE